MSKPAPSFDALLGAAKAGSEWAFTQLFVDYQPVLLRYLRGQAPELADDVASETWMAVARSITGFEGAGNDFRAWLFTVARHRLIDERRRETRQPQTVALVEAAASSASDPATVVMDEMAGDLVAQRIVSLLPADQAEVILLRVVADLSVDQVAAIIEKKPAHVRKLQSRGLKRLAERLSEKGVTQ